MASSSKKKFTYEDYLNKTFNKEDVLESPYLTDFRLKLTSCILMNKI